MSRDLDGTYMGKRVLVAVAQLPFETNNRWFASLIPLASIDGHPILDRDVYFPSHGDIWWMLTPQTKPYGEPGRLLTAVLEEAVAQDRPDKAFYQVVPDSLDAVREDQFVEILTVMSGQVAQARDIVLPSFSIVTDHPPCAIVYARWQDAIYGPLYASSAGTTHGKHLVHIRAARDDRTVFEVPLHEIENNILTSELNVSIDTRPVYQSSTTISATYALLPSRLLTGLLVRARKDVWKTPGDVVREVSKRLFDRRLIFKKDRQNFVRAFEEIETILLRSTEPVASPEELNIFQLIRENLTDIKKEAQELADDLIESGLIDDKVEAGIERRLNEYIERASSELRARIEQSVEERQRELDGLTAKLDEQESEITVFRKRRFEEVDREISERRSQLDMREAEIREKVKTLEKDRATVVETLKEVSKKLAEDKDGLVRHFLALVPLLREFEYLPADKTHLTEVKTEEETEKYKAKSEFALYPFVTKATNEDRYLIKEEEFFERFCSHVKNSGFWHRMIDLVSIHLACKCNDLTILGGQPGTGKSSLPRLYADALAGEEMTSANRYLHLGVSPSWVDGRDLLGFVNAFERSFQPSESGLYVHLVNAFEEEKTHGGNSGMWLVCLDEMNLAQVEHYFGLFLQALERPLGQRTVSCFAPESVSQHNPMYRWATLFLSQNVRFVGTINFDETTRQLSQRLLDRANMIRLRPPRTDPEPMTVAPNMKASGRSVNVFSMNDWRKFGERVPPGIGKVLDEIEEPLLKLGCALNPRRSRAIAHFIANAPESICSPQEALDLQIAQRILPRIRGLFKSGAQEHYNDLRMILENRGGFPESLAVMGEIGEEGLPNLSAFDSEEI